jgi:hypothetical protein
MDEAYDNGDVAGLVWWIPCEPGQHKWTRHKPGQQAPEDWLKLEHECDGYRMERLYGWVKPLIASQAAALVLEAIASESFARGCVSTDLGYGADPEHHAAYAEFLAKHGLVPGDASMLTNAVYPLAASVSNLVSLGVSTLEIPPGAQLLVLGWNCD